MTTPSPRSVGRQHRCAEVGRPASAEHIKSRRVPSEAGRGELCSYGARAVDPKPGGMPMYGLVNIALRDMLLEQHGAATWQQISAAADMDDDAFLSLASYPDALTYRLVAAAVDVLGSDQASLLRAFGRYWLLNTAQRNYSALLAANGDDFLEFMRNLPDFHTRVQLIFPSLKPPEFTCTQLSERCLSLRYESTREGLTQFVVGILEGLGQRFEKDLVIDLVEPRRPGTQHDVFRVSW
jgi:hypothetical protein